MIHVFQKCVTRLMAIIVHIAITSGGRGQQGVDSRTNGGGGSREWTAEQVGEGAAGSGQ